MREKLRAGWKENLKKLSEHALLLGNSEYAVIKKMARNGRKTAVWSVANFGDQSLALLYSYLAVQRKSTAAAGTHT